MIVEAGANTEVRAAVESRRRFLHGLGVLAGSQLVTWSLTLGWTIVVPRILGPKAIGELTTATSATSILLTIVELGLTVLLVRKIAQNRGRAGELIATWLLIQAVLYLPAVGVMGIFIGSQHFDAEQRIVLWLATAAMLPTILKLPFQSAFQATENMGRYAATAVITKLLNSFVGIALVVLGFGVIALAALAAAIEAFTLLLNFRWARPHFKLAWQLNARRAAALAVESLPFSANYIIHSTYLWINAVLLAIFTSATVVGWYGVSSRQVTWTKVMAGALVVNVLLNLVLINYCQARFANGAIGAAISVVVTEGLMSVAGVLILRDLLNRASFLRLGRATLATIVMAAVVVSVRTLGLPVQILAGIVVFPTLAVALRAIAVEEIRDVYVAVRRRRAVGVPA